jgi:pimeloyl-ACP methyl ester carboxylesterase
MFKMAMTRRTFVKSGAMAAGAAAIPNFLTDTAYAASPGDHPMKRNMKYVETEFGKIAYTDQGRGPAALFVHGVFMNSYLWRHVIAGVADTKRCIAIDLMAHGSTRIAPDQDVSFTANAKMLEAFCAKLGLDKVDLVGNDSGGAISQIFAARHPERIRSLTLTNCDVQDNYPPPAFQRLRDLVAAGGLAPYGQRLLHDVEFRRSRYAIAYEHPELVAEETFRIYLEPLFATAEATHNLERWLTSSGDHSQTVVIEPLLRQLQTSTLVVWGTGDVFFPVKWAYWLRDTIPGTRKVIELEGAKLFFPEERPQPLIQALREHWKATSRAAG